MGSYKHWEKLEKNALLLGVLIAIVVSFGGLAEIIPLFNDAQTVKPAPGVTPYEPLRLAGRDVYVREGCYLCHSQMIRTLSFETQRYGARSDAGEFVYDRPFQWGSKRTGPDLARVGGKYSDAWQRAHLLAPRQLVPRVEHAGYPWLAEAKIDGEDLQARCARCAPSAIRTPMRRSRVLPTLYSTRPSSTRWSPIYKGWA